MNEFLEQQGYSIIQKDKKVVIHHKDKNAGCIHFIFIGLLIPSILFSIFIYAFSLAIAGILFFYIQQLRKERRYSRHIVFDFDSGQVVVNRNTKFVYRINDIIKIDASVMHSGSYASAHRNTTEEYRKEISLVFDQEKSLILFSFISDLEETEPEIVELVNWLQKLIGFNVS
ncbi:MAG: hypothetical protein JXR07_08045 [Reichenbachiella sp.]